jgi:hypothetical protein
VGEGGLRQPAGEHPGGQRSLARWDQRLQLI